MENTNMENTSVENTGIENTGTKSVSIESAGIKNKNIKSTNIESATIESTDIESASMRNTFSDIQAAADMPYPPVQVKRKNLRYADAMLRNMGGRHSELSTITQYVYNGLVAQGMGRKLSMEASRELWLVFHKISIVEMHHLAIFGQLACLLGADPRFWSREQKQWGLAGKNGYMRYWNAGYNFYSKDFSQLLKHAVEGERQAIRTYQKQCQWIKDECVRENLERIIKDEELHVQILGEVYMKYTHPQCTGRDTL